MQANPQPGSTPKWMLWTGWILSVLPVLVLLMSAAMKFMKPEDVVQGFGHLGWDVSLALWLGIVELACAILYLIPQTSVLGAILLTGYLGGAIATHVRIGDPYYVPAILGVVIWAGLWLRDTRIRALLPLRS